jgi:undecaprenyl phosphate N,N'-diacetylbacillosamine 1-phosphate transferase
VSEYCNFSPEDWDWLKSHFPSWKKWVKRGIDLMGASIALLLCFPFFFLIALAIKLDTSGDVFFVQERIGYLGKPFRVWKFRTMVQNADKLGDDKTFSKDPRITKVGKFLREWTLDELPQFWNVFKGDMSLVGPRPTLAYQVEAYTPRQKRRLLVKPGLTGLAQISGRNLLSWSQRIELDLQYIENFSLWLDFKILLKTVAVVFSRKGVYGDASL